MKAFPVPATVNLRRLRETGEMPQNFLRHYYDVYSLLGDEGVQAFIGSDAYVAHKAARFRDADDPDLRRNEAFWLRDADARRLYDRAYAATRALYYRDQPPLDDILARIAAVADRL